MANRIIRYDTWLKQLARNLRRSSTKGEKQLWRRIRKRQLGVEFHRQVPIDRYIPDFYCHEIRLAVELDGQSHDEWSFENDLIRQRRLETLGVRFIRFSERDVEHRMDDVIQQLCGVIEDLKSEG